MSPRALTRAGVETALTGARAEIIGLRVQRLALFGSVQRGAARADSDVDLLVEFRPGEETFDHFVSLADLLVGLLGRRVELVTPESLSPFLKPYIIAQASDVLRAA
jgi:predicted nucleotidyltransferase